MSYVNECFRQLPSDYLFTETAGKASEWQERHPKIKLLRLGIGDVTRPIPTASAGAMIQAAYELSSEEGFRGYGPEQGYEFLRKAIAEVDYKRRGVLLDRDEIFISDGAKSDCGGVLDLFSHKCVTALCDPVYPAYIDALAIAGRTGVLNHSTGQWSGLIYLPCTEKNNFVPIPPVSADLVYLCFPNNPTGAMATKEQLGQWVQWACDTGAVILYDGAYEAFIQGDELPHSIYEIEGAKGCAIEFRSFSKTAGFTGVRCAYTVIPKELNRDGSSLNALWKRRQSARFNGVSYLVQRGAEAVCYSPGHEQAAVNIAGYRDNAFLIRSELESIGICAYGGIHAPYVWAKMPEGMDSWTAFDLLLEKAGVVTTPGVGFGSCGEGFLRLTAFSSAEDTKEAMRRIKQVLK